MSTLQAEPAHALTVAAHILRAVARAHRDANTTTINVDTLDAIAAGLDKAAGEQT